MNPVVWTTGPRGSRLARASRPHAALTADRIDPAMTRNGRATTLIEVLVAMTLLGTCVVGLMASATLATRNQQRCGQRVAAMYLAQEKLAEVEMIGPHVWMLGHPTEGNDERDGMVYNWTIRIGQQSVGELFTVEVEVRWNGPTGGEVAMETWLNDYRAKYAETATAEKK